MSDRPLRTISNDLRARAYLGDGVYVHADEAGQIGLTVEDGIHVHHEVFLEREAFQALIQWAMRGGYRIDAQGRVTHERA